MRSLVVGLIGAVLAVGSAQAGQCRADGAMLKAEAGPPADGRNDSLAGARFRVVRVASRFAKVSNAATGTQSNGGDLYLLVEGKTGRFLVTSGFSPGSLPANAATSGRASDARAVRWDKRNRSLERRLDLARSVDVMSGPLAGYTLRNTACR